MLREMIRESRWAAVAFALSALFVVYGVVWAYLSLRGVTTPIILHFDSFSGITRIGSLRELELFGLFGGIVVLVNFCIAGALLRRDRFLSTMTALWTLILAFLLFLGFVAIISVN